MSKRVSGVRAIYYGDAPVTGNPTNDPGNWTSAGRILNAWDPGLVQGSEQDGEGAPIGTHSGVPTRMYELVDLDSYTGLRAKEDAGTRLDIAEELLNGDFRIYRNCKVFVEYNPRLGPNRIQTIQLRISTAAHDWASIRDIVVPV